MDLHLHTPASADWLEPGVSYLQWLQKAESRGLDIVAITDHNTVEGVAQLRAEIERLTWLETNERLRSQERRDLDEYRRLGEKILVLPGFEFTATFGFHVMAIFPPETPLRVLELLLLRLNVPVHRLAEGSTEVGATVDVMTAYRLIDEAGGLAIAAHANSTHGVAMRGINFGGQTKIAFTQDVHLHALEVTDLDAPGRRSSAKFFDGTKPEYPRRMHCIQGSDAHRLTRDPKDKNRFGIGDRVTEFLLSEISFESLAAALKGDDFSVTRPYRPPAEEPFDFVVAAREVGNTIVQAFHESVVLEAGRTNRILADVVAFANIQGGTVFMGASATKKGAPRGVENPPDLIARLQREIEQDITPPLACRADTLQSQGAAIVRVVVPSGPSKPYVLHQTRIYVRQEGETNEAVRDEIIQLVLGTRQAPPAAAEVVRGAEAPHLPAPARPAPVSAAGQPAAEPPAAERPVVTAPAAEPPAAKSPRRRRRRGGAAPEVKIEGPAVVEQPVEPAQPAVVEPPAEPEPTVTPEVAVEPEQLVALEAAVEPAQPVVELAVEPAAAPAGVEAVGEAGQPEPLPAALAAAPAEEEAPALAAKPAKRRTRSRRSDRAKAAAAESVAAVEVVTSEAPALPEPAPVEAPGPTVSAAPAIKTPAAEVAISGELVAAEAAAPEAAAVEIIAESAESPNILEAPAVGVEIVSTEERQGVVYFTIRDLRNCNMVHNVTPVSARKLWSYAINQYLKRPIDPEQVMWRGDYGLWQVGRRAKKLRYDLVKRQPDGSIRAFYGVTADGMDEPWAQFLKDEDRTV